MINSAITFGKKIPMAKCAVFEHSTGKKHSVLISELDCKDFSDIELISQNESQFDFKGVITQLMKNKHFKLNPNLKEYDVSKIYEPLNDHFFISELEDGTALGICETFINPYRKDTCVDFIETEKSKKYKYAGQTLLAALGLNTLKNSRENLVINVPLESAKPFYVDVCGFSEVSEKKLEMKEADIKNFIKTVESRTKSPIIDLEI